MPVDSITAQYLESLTKVGGLYTLAAASKAGLLDAYYGGIISLYEASTGGLMYGGAATASLGLTLGVPIVTAVGVWVALGSGYFQAREEAKKSETLSGFSQGFAMAIIGWKWNNAVDRFRRPYLSINAFDQQMDVIRVNSYHTGLKTGYLAGLALTEPMRKEYSSKIRKAGGIRGPKEWSRNSDIARNQQISYVIEMAAAALRFKIIAAE